MQAVRENRRYVPPAREIWQHIHCTMIPPDGPKALEQLDIYPVLRIGDTFECRFNPMTPFETLCQVGGMPPATPVAMPPPPYRCCL